MLDIDQFEGRWEEEEMGRSEEQQKPLTEKRNWLGKWMNDGSKRR